MRLRARTLAGTAVLALTLGCESRPSVETEMIILELQAEVAQLSTELDYVTTETLQVSRTLNERVHNLEAALEDIHLRVLDLSAGTDLVYAVREVEAAVAVANERLASVRAATNDLSRTVDY